MGSLGEALGGLVFVDFQSALVERLFNLGEHEVYFFRGGGNEYEVVNKNEVGEVVGVEGEAVGVVMPLLLYWGQKMLHS